MKKRNDIMTFRLPIDEKAQLKELADAANVTASDLALLAVRDLIAKLTAKPAKPAKAKA